jgi:hypothetical protein
MVSRQSELSKFSGHYEITEIGLFGKRISECQAIGKDPKNQIEKMAGRIHLFQMNRKLSKMIPDRFSLSPNRVPTPIHVPLFRSPDPEVLKKGTIFFQYKSQQGWQNDQMPVVRQSVHGSALFIQKKVKGHFI